MYLFSSFQAVTGCASCLTETSGVRSPEELPCCWGISGTNPIRTTLPTHPLPKQKVASQNLETGSRSWHLCPFLVALSFLVAKDCPPFTKWRDQALSGCGADVQEGRDSGSCQTGVPAAKSQWEKPWPPQPNRLSWSTFPWAKREHGFFPCLFKF